MKNRLSKTILVFLALGLISCAFCVQQAQAVQITGAINFSGGGTLDNTDLSMAQAVLTWLDQGLNMPTVEGASGSFAGLDGQTAIFANPWVFGSGAPALWTIGGFTFNLIASTIISQSADFLLVSGTGYITGTGFDPSFATWLFSIQEAPAGFVFSWSGGSEAIPDGGATVALLGLALAGIEGIRRKLRSAKS
jgi:VPDSG-CTERM motif